MAKTTRLQLARFAAVVFALGASTWIITRAHHAANPPAAAAHPSPDTEPEEMFSGEETAGDAEPVFLPSSKSAIGILEGESGAFKKQRAKEDAKSKKADPVFLHSSKGFFPANLRKKETPAKDAPDPDAK